MKKLLKSANLYQNSKGNWYYERIKNGNRYKVSLKTKEINEAVTKRDVLNDLLEQTTSHENSKQYSSLSFYQLCNNWFDQKQKTCSKSTVKSYQSVLNNYLFKAPFVNKAIDTIKFNEIDDWCHSFRNTIKINSINNILFILSNVFNYASKMGLVDTNPVKWIDRPKPIMNMPKPFTDEEVDNLIENIDPFYRDYQKMLFLSFLRPSEINKLTPSDIDPTEKVIWIRNQKKVRYQLMSDEIFNLISRQLELAKKQGSKTLFFNKNGKPISSAYYRNKVWRPLLGKTKIGQAGIQYRPIRNCRYTCICKLYNQGHVSINALKQLHHFLKPA
jgi:integrase